jgi:hypothetical protein
MIKATVLVWNELVDFNYLIFEYPNKPFVSNCSSFPKSKSIILNCASCLRLCLKSLLDNHLRFKFGCKYGLKMSSL